MKKYKIELSLTARQINVLGRALYCMGLKKGGFHFAAERTMSRTLEKKLDKSLSGVARGACWSDIKVD